jgi:Asp-tRNA(Asn)/Glu-tRNA(Gln) amidotransferase A subunit family amidase
MGKRSSYVFLVVVGLLLLGVAAVACGGGAEEPPAPPPPEETGGNLSGEELLQARCTKCHSLDQVKTASKTQTEWEATVERMRGKGAELTDQEVDTLSEYLAETYGP